MCFFVAWLHAGKVKSSASGDSSGNAIVMECSLNGTVVGTLHIEPTSSGTQTQGLRGTFELDDPIVVDGEAVLSMKSKNAVRGGGGNYTFKYPGTVTFRLSDGLDHIE